jgi:hypothetical protein
MRETWLRNPGNKTAFLGHKQTEQTSADQPEPRVGFAADAGG